MLLLTIEPDATDPVPATLNVRFDENASVDDIRAAWEAMLNGTLKDHLFHAICSECVNRGINPREVVVEPPAN
jgi:hypothetical protein